MNELDIEIRKQRRVLISASIILHHDNAPTHASHFVSSTIHNLKYELLRHPSYSPDLSSLSERLFFVSCFKRLSQRKTHYNDRSSLGV